MAHTRKNERRVLSEGELDFVDKARHPALAEMPHAELHALIGHLRERRDRAQTIANGQRRALRGKGPGDVRYDKADLGNRQKAAVLTDALTRARREMTRRNEKAAREELMANARHAWALKQAAGGPQHPDGGPTANEGMRAKARQRVDSLARPAEAGRVTKFVATAQAKKDNR
ncbi:hypothetical protein [Roseixanthobacter liquoris]|uniref:hypothetical protein n=1 Tax=Roseixanthobacter liquoris TaxID=3119921 RepID=UPI0037268F32